MARNRANIEPGQTAFVGDLRFGPGQLLPEGTQEYQVTGFMLFSDEDAAQYGTSGIPYSFTVAVGTSKRDIMQLAEDVVDMTLEEGEWWANTEDMNQGFLWYTMGL